MRDMAWRFSVAPLLQLFRDLRGQARGFRATSPSAIIHVGSEYIGEMSIKELGSP
jgi:hypothetical protein